MNAVSGQGKNMKPNCLIVRLRRREKALRDWTAELLYNWVVFYILCLF